MICGVTTKHLMYFYKKQLNKLRFKILDFVVYVIYFYKFP